MARIEARMCVPALFTAALVALITGGESISPINTLGGVVPVEPTLRSCEPIRVELCMGLGYNVTGMPNLVGHELQGDADFTLHTFSPLIQYGCSARLLFFLCSVYVPMCTEKVLQPIGPCRGLCESVRSRCYPVLQGFGFPWPAALNCSKFPSENNHEHMCMEGPGDEIGASGNIPTTERPHLLPKTSTPRTRVSSGPCSRLARPELYVYVNRTGRCAPRCEADVLFTQDDKRLAEVWLTVWAGLCFISSLITLLSFLVDSARFRYPERPVAFLALCYNLASVGWGVRAAAGRSAVACHLAPPGPTPGLPSPLLLLSHDGLANANCAVVFLLLYYFGMAAAVWWVVLAAGWFLAAGLKVAPERLARHSSLGHLAAWGLPAAQTVAVLVLRDVDADELTGACFVGNQSSRSLLIFVLIPHLTYLALGAAFLLAGLACLLRNPRPRVPPPPAPRPLLPQPGGTKMAAVIAAAQHEALIARVGVLGALYTVPAICVVASLFYEYTSRDEWLLQPTNGAIPEKPSLWVFILRLFMSLVVGVTSAAWVWSSKTLKSWHRLFQRFIGPPPRKVVDIPAATALPLTSMSRGSSRGGHSYVYSPPLQTTPNSSSTGSKFHHTHTHHHHHHHPRPPIPHHKSHRSPSSKQQAGSETTV